MSSRAIDCTGVRVINMCSTADAIETGKCFCNQERIHESRSIRISITHYFVVLEEPQALLSNICHNPTSHSPRRLCSRPRAK